MKSRDKAKDSETIAQLVESVWLEYYPLVPEGRDKLCEVLYDSDPKFSEKLVKALEMKPNDHRFFHRTLMELKDALKAKIIAHQEGS